MKIEQSQHIDISARLKDLEHFTGALVARRLSEPDVVPIHEVPAARVPVPRRSRVFLRGHGAFAELTLTAPRVRPAHD